MVNEWVKRKEAVNERMSDGKIEARRKGKKEETDLHLQRASHGWRFQTSNPQSSSPSPALQLRPSPSSPLPHKPICACAVSHVTVRLRPRLRPPACCESGLSLRQHQVSCEACNVWARPSCVAELALHAGKGVGAAAAGAGAGIRAKSQEPRALRAGAVTV